MWEIHFHSRRSLTFSYHGLFRGRKARLAEPWLWTWKTKSRSPASKKERYYYPHMQDAKKQAASGNNDDIISRQPRFPFMPPFSRSNQMCGFSAFCSSGAGYERLKRLRLCIWNLSLCLLAWRCKAQWHLYLFTVSRPNLLFLLSWIFSNPYPSVQRPR